MGILIPTRKGKIVTEDENVAKAIEELKRQNDRQQYINIGILTVGIATLIIVVLTYLK